MYVCHIRSHTRIAQSHTVIVVQIYKHNSLILGKKVNKDYLKNVSEEKLVTKYADRMKKSAHDQTSHCQWFQF